MCVVRLCLSLLEALSVSLRHVRNAAGEVGDERKERGNKRTEGGPGSSGPHLCQCSLPAVQLKVEDHLLRMGKICSLSLPVSRSPQAVGCDIIDPGGGKSLKRGPLCPHVATTFSMQLHKHMKSCICSSDILIFACALDMSASRLGVVDKRSSGLDDDSDTTSNYLSRKSLRKTGPQISVL